MADFGTISVRFWGVRGSIACPGPDTVRYGGNTSCVEIRCGGELLIMDGGPGLRELGRDLLKNGPINADLFYTHTHFDHICGLPFFGPAYVHGNMIRLWAGHLLPDNGIEDVLCGMMMAPLFPVPGPLLAVPRRRGATWQFSLRNLKRSSAARACCARRWDPPSPDSWKTQQSSR